MLKNISISQWVTPLLSLACACLLPVKHARAQSNYQSVYLELGGNGLFSSVNYERQIRKEFGLILHAGAGIYGMDPSYLTIPVGLRYQIGLKNKNRFLDIGAGITRTKADVTLYAIVEHKDPKYVNTSYWNFIPSISYRKITKNKLILRYSLSPVINQYGFLPYLGFSLGKSL